MTYHIIETFVVTERGVRKQGHHCPHSMEFPALMSALRTFMGLESGFHKVEDGGTTWIFDDDYFFQMGVSGEGYGLKYDTFHFLQSGKWNNEQLDDCFGAEGIEYRFTADESFPIKDVVLDTGTIRKQVIEHLQSDLPLIIIKRQAKHFTCELVIGYADYGNSIIAHRAGKCVNLGKNAKTYSGWSDDVCAVIFIDGLTEPAERKDIILRSLSRAYEMLQETGTDLAEYGSGAYMWDKWLARLDDDHNYRLPSHELRYITPEKFDLAERRYFAGEFLKQAEAYFGEESLTDAVKAFSEINDKMWEIHFLVTGDNKGKLLERETRDRIIGMIKYCRELDLIAATNIKKLLDGSQLPDHRTVTVIGSDGTIHNPTYQRRAKGLVNKNRAQWVDDATIRLKDENMF